MAEIDQDTNLKWWDPALKDPSKVGQVTYNAAKFVFDNQTARERELSLYALQYGGLGPEVDIPFADEMLSKVGKTQRNAPRLSLNVIRSVVDTAVAKITALEVRPMYLSAGGSWTHQRQAKRLEKFSDGQLHAAEMRTLGPEVFRDGCWGDTGAAHVYREGKDPKVERVLPWELGVDKRDARYGKPRMMFRQKWIPREALKERWPEHAEEIDSAGLEDDGSTYGEDSNRLADEVLVFEAWCLPGLKSKGRHVVALSNVALVDEEWDRPKFPFAFMRYSKPLRGFHGVGMARHLSGNQREINHGLKKLQEIIQKLGPKILIAEGSRVPKQHLNNEILGLITYVGQPPVAWEPGDVPPSLLKWIEDRYTSSFDQEGVSRMDARSVSRAGLNSEPSIRAERDIGTERFSVATKYFEQFVLDVSELLIEEARAIAEEDKDYAVLVPMKRYAERLLFREVNLKRTLYVIQNFPASALPRDPSGRLAMVQDLLQAGMLDPTMGRRLLAMPDVDSALDLENAALDAVLCEIERVLDGEPYQPPESYFPLELGLKYFQVSYLKARSDGAPDDVLDDLRRWIDEAQARVSSSALGQPGLPAGAPLGKPQGQQTSSLLPVAQPAAA